MSSAATETEATATTTTATATIAGEAAKPVPTVAELRLPTWYFGFEGGIAGAFDLLHAFPAAWPALVALIATNIAVSLTVLRPRLKLAALLWRGKSTRNIALALLGLRIGSHVALGAIGFGVTSTLGHVAFAVVMAALTVTLMAYAQRTSLRALVAAGKATAA
ncbi:hypothetical protein J5Y04_12510 [Kitasatospora sp. RG8]|uniref:hypothetical protein n=1 Tax=Kitasatospora sp. RG8 TaxID=2820815 RepID=UPI001AE01232|nr:hypothetical protein [Kitasatospora sp. RG8]MBP0450373.1 hypothetical protein [Kitasatospora sp. RG8]